MNKRLHTALVLLSAGSLSLLTGCDALKNMLNKNADAGVDAGVVDAAPAVAEPVDAGVDAAPPPPTVVSDDIPGPNDEDTKAKRDIGFGNFKEELDKLEKEVEKDKKK